MIKFVQMSQNECNIDEIFSYINSYLDIRSQSISNYNHEEYNSNFNLDKIMALAGSINSTWKIDTTVNISSYRKLTSRFIIIIKKIIKKMIKWYLDAIFARQEEHNANVTRLLNEIVFNMQRHNRNQEYIKNKLDSISDYINLQQKASYEKKSSSCFNYVEFQYMFRGSFDEIKNRFNEYLPYFIDKKNVIDLGCGRGEMLELLKENGVNAYGIDSDKDMIKQCLSRGLNVRLCEAIQHIKSVDDYYFDGIFCSQMIEHLELGEILTLIRTSNKKLKPGGIIIFETVNPLSLGVFAYSFYIDPTHIKPVHPATLKFLLEQTGYKVKDLVFKSPYADEYKLAKYPESEEKWALLNKNIDKLNEQIYGYQDYAIICEKI